MRKRILKTGERVIPENIESREEYLLYLRHLCAYEFVKDIIPKDSLVLELGCGEGYGTNLLSQHFRKIVGLDVDRNTIDHASRKYCSENCFFEVYDGLENPYGDNTFDAVVSFQVIEHLRDDKKYVSEIYRVLKKKSKFILTTPNRIYRLNPGQRPWNRFHVREYSPCALNNILRNNFSDVTLWGICGSEKVQKIEMERVRQILRISSFDPLYLRNLIPEQFKPKIISALKKIVGRNRRSKNDKDFLQKYTLKDFYITKNDVENSLDLLGICTK